MGRSKEATDSSEEAAVKTSRHEGESISGLVASRSFAAGASYPDFLFSFLFLPVLLAAGILTGVLAADLEDAAEMQPTFLPGLYSNFGRPWLVEGFSGPIVTRRAGDSTGPLEIEIEGVEFTQGVPLEARPQLAERNVCGGLER